MSRLKTVLEDYDRSYLGADPGSEEARKKELRSQLLTVRSTNENYFRVTVALLVAFFICCWVLVFLNRNQPNYLVMIFGALGGSVFGCVWAMAKLWQTKIATDIAIVMMDDLPPAEFKLAIRTLVKRL